MIMKQKVGLPFKFKFHAFFIIPIPFSYSLCQGFLRHQVQEEMNQVQAARPYHSSVSGTLREKHNTVMGFVNSVIKKQEEKFKKEGIDATKADEGSEIDKMSIECFKSEDCVCNKVKLGYEKVNVITEGLFIGSMYVGNMDPDQPKKEESRSNSWRVRL